MYYEDFSHPNGEGGTAFQSTRGKVQRVDMNVYSHPDGRKLMGSIQLFFDEGSPTTVFGDKRDADDKASFPVPIGDAIVKAEVESDWGTEALRFTTRNGVVSPWYGGARGQGSHCKIFEAPPGQELVGISGRAGGLIDKIEFQWAAEVAPSKVICCSRGCRCRLPLLLSRLSLPIAAVALAAACRLPLLLSLLLAAATAAVAVAADCRCCSRGCRCRLPLLLSLLLAAVALAAAGHCCSRCLLNSFRV